ncbi:zinc-binding dehydrogenase [Microbacterium amylolyticum]|uniref:NADPH:quinone reductase-like Zn-dependent oxidoreductase n=1 Tax=Microbacterium amylolyticum TaxID=936337 RepID=A0ABS4ZG92_9MICO|nr:zinc-binding dehydrogenase [Microbacterium amylolyticum]MBP2436303.1 NADPH:quinone reductase-like Zn-dependent oxidoreductase [Microbacterium amylolyticum]
MRSSTPAVIDLTQLIARGHVSPVITGTYGLDDAQRAIASLGRGRGAGKVVVTID